MIHKSGTSFSSGRSSTSGISFNLSGRARPRVWLGGGRGTSKRQSIRAQEAEPLSYWPAFVIPLLIIIFHAPNESYGGWSLLGFVFSVLWFALAWSDHTDYEKEWLCSKCGAKFIPEEFIEANHKLINVQEALEVIVPTQESKQEKRIYDNLENKMTSSKDYTKYMFGGEKHGKGRLVLSVLKEHVATHPNVTYEDLKEVFPDSLQSNTETQFSSTQVVFDKEKEVKQSDLKRFFLKEEEIITIKDCKVVVSREWNRQNIQNFINAAGQLGFDICVANESQA